MIDNSLIQDLTYRSCQANELTKGLPFFVLASVVSDVLKKSIRVPSIIPLIEKYLPDKTKEEIHLASQIIVNKTYVNRDRHKSQKIGLNWYIWKHTNSVRDNPAHEILDGVLVNWNYPPSPEYLSGEPPVGVCHAGENVGCLCLPSTLIDVDYITWPHKLYYDCKIMKIDKRNFLKNYKNHK